MPRATLASAGTCSHETTAPFWTLQIPAVKFPLPTFVFSRYLLHMPTPPLPLGAHALTCPLPPLASAGRSIHMPTTSLWPLEAPALTCPQVPSGLGANPHSHAPCSLVSAVTAALTCPQPPYGLSRHQHSLAHCLPGLCRNSHGFSPHWPLHALILDIFTAHAALCKYLLVCHCHYLTSAGHTS